MAGCVRGKVSFKETSGRTAMPCETKLGEDPTSSDGVSSSRRLAVKVVGCQTAAAGAAVQLPMGWGPRQPLRLQT
jgi:hypothetical protein